MITLWEEEMWFWQAPFYILLWISTGSLVLLYLAYEMIDMEITDAYHFLQEKLKMEQRLDLMAGFHDISYEALKGFSLQELDDFFFNLGMLPATATKIAKAIKFGIIK